MRTASDGQSGSDRDSSGADSSSPAQASAGANLTDNTPSSAKSRKGTVAYLLMSLGVCGVILVGLILTDFFRGDEAVVQPPAARPIPVQYNPDRAMSYLKAICNFGSRPSGSQAMQRQQVALENFFAERGAAVSYQRFDARHPEDGSAVPMANLIASWGTDRPKRFLFCAHYDTRPFPDSDPTNPKGLFVGANDGASGTAALMELANQLGDLPKEIGVDIVLFDGEEFIFEQGRDEYFLGSKFFARAYQASPPTIRYRSGILLDMIGDRELRIYFEQNSVRYARSVAKDVWRVAKRLGVTAFIPRVRHTIQDDHLPLNQIAGIPTIDLIDFDYPRPGIGQPSYWHTTKDVPENCSGESLAAVVWVVHQWLIDQ